jgi:hypothetical protein
MPKPKIWKDPDTLVKDLRKYWRNAQATLAAPEQRLFSTVPRSRPDDL